MLRTAHIDDSLTLPFCHTHRPNFICFTVDNPQCKGPCPQVCNAEVMGGKTLYNFSVRTLGDFPITW